MNHLRKFVPILCAAVIMSVVLLVGGCGSDSASKGPAHLYDKAKVVDLMSGNGKNVVGSVSIIEAKSTDVTQEALEDWFYNYVDKHVGDKAEDPKLNYCVILYTDKNKEEGVHSAGGVVTKDVPIEKDKHGTYSMKKGGTVLAPTADKHLKPVE